MFDFISNLFSLSAGEVIPTWMDFSAVVVGSMSGALIAMDKKLDLVGIIAAAMLTGLGGGLIRDTVMQVGDVYFLNSHYAIAAALFAGVTIFCFHGLFEEIPHIVEWIDIMSVALFVVCGTEKALTYNLSSIACVFMGTITGVGGGMLRDSMTGDIPRIFRKSNFYAICAVVGAIVYTIAGRYFGINRTWVVILCFVTVVGLRRFSLRYNWQSPAGVDWSDHVTKPYHKVKSLSKSKRD